MDHCENLNGSMLDPLDYAKFIESTWLLSHKAFTYGKIGPHLKHLIVMCSGGRPPTQKRSKFHAIGLKGMGPASRCKAALRSKTVCGSCGSRWFET